MITSYAQCDGLLTSDVVTKEHAFGIVWLTGLVYRFHETITDQVTKLVQDNAHIGLFNGSFRDECLNTGWFMSLQDAREKIERWKNDYNEFRPHSALTYQTPAEYARKSGISAV